jgi:hypothetical protein
LIEKGIDENLTIEHLSFDQLIGELRKAGVKVPKSGTLKALNKIRLTVKHYGQLAEPKAVSNFAGASLRAVDAILLQVVDVDLDGVFAAARIEDGEAKQFIAACGVEIQNRRFFEALVEARKALFVEIETDYDVSAYRDPKYKPSIFELEGWKAPYYSRNTEWVSENVREPFDYIQLDHERVRLDLMEWGVRTQDFWNVRRLTPSVFRLNNTKEWIFKEDYRVRQHADERTAKYCADMVLRIISKKKSHQSAARSTGGIFTASARVRLRREAELRQAADAGAPVIERLPAGSVHRADYSTPSLRGNDEFVHLSDWSQPGRLVLGFVVSDACEFVADEQAA